MPVRKFRTIEEMNVPHWRDVGDPDLMRAIADLWLMQDRPRIDRRNLETNSAVPRRRARGDYFAGNFWAATWCSIVEFRFRSVRFRARIPNTSAIYTVSRPDSQDTRDLYALPP